ncbi:MAG TPA: DUF2442 domain-containing protein [Candidatus Kapabacteria bacterium]|jgi:hypothetical protein|nr:DUF2442 domain-containing protein [Candidatus Kapabacteria bacterium]
MKTSDYKGVRASSLSVSATYLDVTLEDGRMLRIPVTLFPKLSNAPSEKLAHWEWIGEGIGIEWPELDEHLSIAGFLRETPYFVSSNTKRSDRSHTRANSTRKKRITV